MPHTHNAAGVWGARNVETVLEESGSLWDTNRGRVVVIETASVFHDEAEEDLEDLAQISPPYGWQNVFRAIYCVQNKWLAHTQWEFCCSDGAAPDDVV